MSIAAKHFDPQLGIDIHMYAMPPCPLPTPHIGLLLDPFDFIPIIGSTIKVNGVHRGTAGTGGLDIHIPLGLWAPPLAAPMGPQFDGEEIFMGSRTVSADGEPFSRLAMPVLDCNLAGMINPFRMKKPKKPLRALMLPTGLNVAIPTAVKVGGPPTVSWTALAFRAAFAGLGRLRKTEFFRKKMDAFRDWRRARWGHLPPGFFKCRIARAEPVDIRDGSVLVNHQDFEIPGRLPLAWRRVYASRHAQRDGACGHGWQTPADVRLGLAADGSVWLSGPDEVAFFPERPQHDGVAAATLDFVDGARLWHEGGQWVVRFKSGLQYRFDDAAPPNVAMLPQEQSLLIERIEDRCGNHWRFERHGGHLVRIVESGVDGLQGRFIEVEARHGHIDSMSLHDPGTGLNHLLVRYRYADGDLIAAVDPLDAPRTFAYTGHALVRHTDRVGLSFYYTYDAQGRVVHSWGDGGLYDYHFAYDELLHETQVTDSLGHVSVIKFDGQGLPLCEIDPLDGVTVFEYDDFGRTVAVTDPEGLRTGFTYDERGNLLRLVRADGTEVVLAYDEDDQVTQLQTPDGGAWQHVYSPRGELIRQVDPAQAQTQFVYSPHGQLITQTNARDASTTVAYDRHGLVTAITDPLGFQTLYAHDVLGRLLQRTDALGAVTRYDYDAKGRLSSVKGCSGARVTCEYDGEDRLARYTDEAGAQTRLRYVGLGQVAERLQPDGNAVAFRYDSEERLLEVTNQRGEGYRVVHDALGRVIEESDYWGQSKRFEYDAAGRLTASTDALGQRVAVQTDKLGRITQRRLPDPHRPGQVLQETIRYDARGRAVELSTADRSVIRTFDAVGYLASEDQDGFQIRYAYDAVGNRIRRQTSAGNVLHTQFDACDRAIEVAINDEPPIRIERDALGRARLERLGDTLERHLAYDGNGLLARQAVLVDGAPLLQTRYDYDAVGNLTQRKDSTYGTESYRYDALGRLLQHVDPSGRVERFFADPAGDRLRTEVIAQQARRRVGEADPPPLEWRREGVLEGVKYVYDRAGDLVSRCRQHTEGTEPLVLQWDANHRLIASSRGAERTTYGYDALGRRAFKRGRDATTWFFWDGDALLAEVRQDVDDSATATTDTGNVISLMAAHRRKRQLAALHADAREYVYQPESFVPLALIEPRAYLCGKGASVLPAARDDRKAQARTRMQPQLQPAAVSAEALAPKPFNPVAKSAATPTAARVTGVGMGQLGGMQLGGAGDTPPRLPESEAVPVAAPQVLAQDVAPLSEDTDADADVSAVPVATAQRVLFYINDPNGCPNRLVTTSGELVWAAQLSAWGQLQSLDVDAVCNNLRLQGQYHDDETGLHYNRHRYYDPVLGQFIGQDPLRLQAGENLYEFGPSAINWMDALGLSCDEVLDPQAMVNLQRRLANLVHQVRDELLNDPKLLRSFLRPKEIEAIQDEPWRMRLFFGTALQRRVNELKKADELLDKLVPTTGNAPRDYIGPGNTGFEITGGSWGSLMSHSKRPEVDVIVTYESLPSTFGYETVQGGW